MIWHICRNSHIFVCKKWHIKYMEAIIEKFKALSDETRLRILNLFLKSGKNLCVCELMDALQLPQYAISKALTIMKNAGLFTTAKEGTWVYYKLNKDIQENKALFNFINNYLTSPLLDKDEERLNKRLLLREKDKCVVGIIPEEDLLKLIKEKL
ncbi:helix-turn-helix transcriptional regulator [Ignavibacterium album]|uniref:ArsR/SmtB family transcription factor n=2 Tax=Ignavibacteriaceae TaxID=795749 RepID=UPI0026F2D4F6|nr:metalloregulator ArsR/SmtB family transcription factor [Ignavibacterium album]